MGLMTADSMVCCISGILRAVHIQLLHLNYRCLGLNTGPHSIASNGNLGISHLGSFWEDGALRSRTEFEWTPTAKAYVQAR